MRKIPTLDNEEELTNSDILELTTEEKVHYGYSGGAHNLDILGLTNEENAYYGYSGGAHQIRFLGAHKWRKCLLQILYSGGAHQLEKKFKDILELTNAARNGPLLFFSLSGCK